MSARLYAGGARAAEAVNGVLTAALLALFGAVVVQGSHQADFASLTRVADWSAAPACVPIIFLSLVRLIALSSVQHGDAVWDHRSWTCLASEA